MTEIVTDALLTIKQDNEPIDLFMVEVMHMQHKMATETKLIKGLVMDHGGRHPDMPKSLENCYILTCNVSLEYEKTEVNSSFMYSNPEQREKLLASERKYVDEQCRRIIDLKRKVCDGTNKNFVVINQKGIDPLSLDILAKDGIIGLRRAKKRNMERLILACGGNAVNSFDDLCEKDLGFAEKVYEQTLGEDKYTFVEGVTNPFSCTILIKGPNEYTIAQIKDAIRDGLRAVKNVFDDQCVVPGAGAFEIGCCNYLMDYSKDEVNGKQVLGIEAFANALLIIPKCIADNAGQDALQAIINCTRKIRETKIPMGIDISNGEPINPMISGIIVSFFLNLLINNLKIFCELNF
jgi:T-complex protein 1 subunit zeta